MDLTLWQQRFPRCCRAFLSVVEHLLQMQRCSSLVSQHYVPLQYDQKVSIHGLIQYKWPEH